MRPARSKCAHRDPPACPLSPPPRRRGPYQRYKLRTFVMEENGTTLAATILDIHSEGNVEILFSATCPWARGLGFNRTITAVCAQLALQLGGKNLYVVSRPTTATFWGKPDLVRRARRCLQPAPCHLPPLRRALAK